MTKKRLTIVILEVGDAVTDTRELADRARFEQRTWVVWIILVIIIGDLVIVVVILRRRG